MQLPFQKGTFPIIVQIWELRAGDNIRIRFDRGVRRRDPEGSEYYKLASGETIEAQEFTDIFVGTKGTQVLMVFSPRPHIFLPVKFLWRIIGRDQLTTEEEKELAEIKGDTTEKTEKQKQKRLTEIFKKRFDVEIATMIDSDTLNHLVYKLQKNKIRLTPKGLSPTVIMALVIVFVAVAVLIILWGSYSYWLEPQLAFMKEAQANLVQLYSTKCGSTITTPASPIPTTP